LSPSEHPMTDTCDLPRKEPTDRTGTYDVENHFPRPWSPHRSANPSTLPPKTCPDGRTGPSTLGRRHRPLPREPCVHRTYGPTGRSTNPGRTARPNEPGNKVRTLVPGGDQHPWTGQRPTPPHRGGSAPRIATRQGPLPRTTRTHPKGRGHRRSRCDGPTTNLTAPAKNKVDTTLLTGDRPCGRCGHAPCPTTPHGCTHPCDARPQHPRTGRTTMATTPHPSTLWE